MIAKKVKNPKKSASKSARIGGLTDYIVSPENKNSNEKCIYTGSRGFISDDHQSHKAEMLALSQEAVRSKDTVNHYVLSWREGEQPVNNQVEDAVTIFLDELGLNDHQVIYGLHADTDNIHLHLAINRVHPDTLKVIKPNKGFDIEAAHKAIARIEHKQGWQREQNGRYQVLESGELKREQLAPNKSHQPDQPKRDMEQRTGEKSAERIAIEEATPIIKQAQTWRQLHRELAEKGFLYEKTGSGATLFVGAVGVKASSVDRSASLAQLQKRLGPYEPSNRQQQMPKREPEPIKPSISGWNNYMVGRKTHYLLKNKDNLVQKRQQDTERSELAARQKHERQNVLAGNWKGQGEALNALRSVLAAQQAAEKIVIRERHKKERETLRKKHPSFPDFELWQREQKHPELAEQWRHRHEQASGIEGQPQQATPKDIRAFMYEIHGGVVYYRPKEGGDVSFVDTGKRINVHDDQNKDSVLAAMQLAEQKWPQGFTVTGSDEYKAECAKLAAQHGFRINNTELQDDQILEQERPKVTQSNPKRKSKDMDLGR